MRSNFLSTMLVFAALAGATCATPTTCAEDLKPFKTHAVTGDSAGKETNYFEVRKDQPTLYVFVAADQWARPVARYVKKLDDALAAGIPEANDARVVVVWLTDDVAKAKEYLPKAQMSLQLSRSDWTVFEGEKAGPAGWNVDVAATLTTVVVRQGKESGRFGYKSVNEADVPEAVEALKKKK